MHLITPLSAGINGAGSGHAIVYKRGTTTAATWYTDFEGTDPQTGNVTLDSNGGAEVYVNELVTVKVYDSSSALVRTFTAGVDSPAVEVKSQSFTGQNYETATQAAGAPTTLQAVLDKWKTSSGTTDFNVRVNGNKTKLSTFANLVTENVFNVQDSAYGAAGDGTTDDTSAIQAAIDAAETAGGGRVFFPAGTYVITSKLTLPDGVDLAGFSADTATIEVQASGAFDALETEAASSVRISNLSITASTSITGALVKASGTVLVLSGAVFDATTADDTSVSLSAGKLVLSDCRMSITATSQAVVMGAGTTVSGDRVTVLYSGSGSAAAAIETSNSGSGCVGTLVDCVFDASGFSSANDADFVNIKNSSDAFTLISPTVVAQAGAGDTNVYYNETSGSRALAVVVGGRMSSGVEFDKSEGFTSVVGRSGRFRGENTAAMSVDPSLYEVEYINRDDSTALTLSVSNTRGVADGMMLTIAVENVGPGNSVGFSSDFSEVTSPSVGAGKMRVMQFVYLNGSWVEIGTSADTA